MGSVWEVLGDIVGSGAIVDSRLVSREEGVQFALELGSKTLTLEAIKKKIPDTEMTTLKEDSLKINWLKYRPTVHSLSTPRAKRFIPGERDRDTVLPNQPLGRFCRYQSIISEPEAAHTP